MDNSIRIKGEAYIRYHQDPISGFEAYSTKEQKVDAYLSQENDLFQLEPQFEFQETKKEAYWSFGLTHEFNSNPKITIKELKSVRLLKNHFQITLIFDESKNPQIDPLWAYPRRFTAKVRFKGKAPELLLKNFRSIKNVLN
jgi:hypothetical protein